MKVSISELAGDDCRMAHSINGKTEEAIMHKSVAGEQKHDSRIAENLLEVLENSPGVSYAFVSDGICGIGPTLISAVELICCLRRGVRYAGPFPEYEFVEIADQLLQQQKATIASVRRPVQCIRRSGVTFALIWQAFGERQTHVVHSADYDFDDALEAVVDCLRDELTSQVML